MADVLEQERINENKKATDLDCPQKVRHFLGAFLFYGTIKI
jgi:hypothetical protein